MLGSGKDTAPPKSHYHHRHTHTSEEREDVQSETIFITSPHRVTAPPKAQCLQTKWWYVLLQFVVSITGVHRGFTPYRGLTLRTRLFKALLLLYGEPQFAQHFSGINVRWNLDRAL